MKHRALAYAGVVLGAVALASSFAEPVALANGNSGPTATIVVTCKGTGILSVDYTYSGFSGAVRNVQIDVGNFGTMLDPVKGGSGEANQAFNQSLLGHSIDWGGVSAQLLSHTGKVMAGSTLVWNNGSPTTC